MVVFGHDYRYDILNQNISCRYEHHIRYGLSWDIQL